MPVFALAATLGPDDAAANFDGPSDNLDKLGATVSAPAPGDGEDTTTVCVALAAGPPLHAAVCPVNTNDVEQPISSDTVSVTS